MARVRGEGERKRVRVVYVSERVVLTVGFPKGVIDELDELVKKGYFANRSDAVREAVRRLVVTYKSRLCSQHPLCLA